VTVVARALRPRAIMRRSLAELYGAEIRRPSGKTVGDVGQDHASIHGRRAGFEAEIKVFGFTAPGPS
jgi:hypothetical protein